MRDRWPTILLAICVVGLAAMVVRRELPSSRAETGVQPPLIVEKAWRKALRTGTWLGDSTAPIVLVEFVDLQCAGCRTFHPILQHLRGRFGHQVAEVFVHFPIQYHPRAFEAAQAAECAERAHAFTPFLDAAFRQPTLVDGARWDQLMRASGIDDSASFLRCMRGSESARAVNADLAVGHLLHVEAAPTVIVNGWRFRYPPNEEYLAATISQLLAGRVPQHRDIPAGEIPAELRTGGAEVRFDSVSIANSPAAVVQGPATVIYGGTDVAPDYDLTYTRAAASRSDGSLAVLALHDQRILVFDSAGRPAERLGGRGQAPSEFQRAEDFVVLPNDSILVLDLGNRKWAWFDANGRYVRSIQLPESFPNTLGRIAGRFEDGRLLLSSMEVLQLPDADTVTRVPISVEVVSAGGSARQIMDVPGIAVTRMTTRYRGRLGTRPAAVRFGPRTHVILWNGYIVVETGEHARIGVYDLQGAELRHFEFPFRRRAVTRQLREAAVEAEWERLHGAGTESLLDPQETMREIRETPTSDSLDAISDLIVGRDRRLWIVESRTPEQAGWSAVGLNPDGSLAGRVTSPAVGEPLLFGADFVIVAETDADGVRSFKRYPFQLRR